MGTTWDWPQVDSFADHWSWRPDWTAQRLRFLWYLTFEGAPEVHRLAEAAAERLRTAGADVIPARWLHLTVSDTGPAEEVDPSARAAAAAAVRAQLRAEPPLDLTLGPVAVLPGAVVLPALPREQLATIRDAVVSASAAAGIDPPEDRDSTHWPHVSLCYVNGWTDHDALWAAVRNAGPGTARVRCDRLEQVLVTRRDGQYRWEVVDEVRLGDRAAAGAPLQEAGRAR